MKFLALKLIGEYVGSVVLLYAITIGAAYVFIAAARWGIHG